MEKSNERLDSFMIFVTFMVVLLFIAKVISLVFSQHINFRMRMALDFKTKVKENTKKIEDRN